MRGPHADDHGELPPLFAVNGIVPMSGVYVGAAASGSANVNAGHWNDTVYGKQWWQLAMIIGVGAAHV